MSFHLNKNIPRSFHYTSANKKNSYLSVTPFIEKYVLL